MVGVPWWLTTGATSFGGEVETAFKEDATYEQAGGSALISAGAEILTEKLSGGIKFGGTTLDDVLLKPLTEKIANKTVRTLTNLGVDAVGEGTEEVITSVISNLGTSLYKEESIGEIHRGVFRDQSNLKFAIMIKNKTSRPIYIDKATCFAYYSRSKTRRYYDQQEYTVTEGGSSGTGASINLGSVANALGVGGAVGALAGGVNVGGNNENFGTVSRIYKMERLLKIPAHSSVALSEDNCEDLPSNSRKPLLLITGAYEDFALPKLSLNIDEEIEFTENNTPKKNDYTITYSFNQELTNYFVVKFGVYLKDAFGVKEWYKKCHNRIKLSPKTIPIVEDVEKKSIFQY